MKEKREDNPIPLPPNLIAPVLFSYASIKIVAMICSTLVIFFTDYWWLGAIMFLASLLIKAWFSTKEKVDPKP